MRILLWCNAGREVGMGHLMRQLTLAETAIARGHQVTVAGLLDEQAVALVRRRQPTVEIRPQVPHESLGNESPGVFTDPRFDVVHLDSYDSSLDAAHTVVPNVLSNMQDGGFGKRVAHLVVDANIGAETRVITKPDRQGEHAVAGVAVRPWVLAGIDAVLIREQVRTARRRRHTATLVENRDAHAQQIRSRVLVVIGGTDPTDTTLRVVEQIIASGHAIAVTVIAPERQHEKLGAMLSSSRCTGEIMGFTDDLPRLAATHDLIVSAAGTSVWDFAHIGVPMMLTYVADNQVPGYESSIEQGIALGVGDGRDLTPDTFIPVFTQLFEDEEVRDELVARAQQLVDGLGAWRVVSMWEALNTSLTSNAGSLQKLLNEHPRQPAVWVRAATIEDAKVLYEWRNHPDTRAVSRNPDEVVWEEHVNWLTATLKHPARLLGVAETPDGPIGTVRWDEREDGWEISITTAPESRGKGYATQMVKQAEAFLQDHLSRKAQNVAGKPARLIAVIHETNTPSLRLFMKSRYVPYLPANQEGFVSLSTWLTGRLSL